MKVTEIKNIPFINLIPEEHRRWVEQEVEFEEEPDAEESGDEPSIQDGELILYDRYGRLKKLKKMARLIDII